MIKSKTTFCEINVVTILYHNKCFNFRWLIYFSTVVYEISIDISQFSAIKLYPGSAAKKILKVMFLSFSLSLFLHRSANFEQCFCIFLHLSLFFKTYINSCLKLDLSLEQGFIGVLIHHQKLIQWQVYSVSCNW